ncbi:MAG: hypothetical protein RL220_805 [Bacteroidota bacterium]
MKSVIALALTVTSLSCAAQLDVSFGNSGIVITDFEISNDQAYCVTTDNQGRILTAGSSDAEGGIGFGIVRYLENGQPDPEFGVNGFAVFVPGSTAALAYDITTYADNRIILCGMIDGQFGAMRLSEDGSPDNNFGENGVTIIDLPGFIDRAEAVEIDSNGKIVIAGYSGDIGSNDFAVVRLNEDGSVDESFGNNGSAIVPVLEENDEAKGMAIQADGKILLAGSSYNGLQTDLAVVRFNTDGSLDETFSGDGKMTFDLGSSYDAVNDIIVQPDGKILLAGESWFWPNFAMLVARLNPDGNFDNGFGNAGISLSAFSQFTSPANCIELQTDGKIIAAGYVMLATEYDFALVRLMADGSPDNSFGTDGKVVTHPGDSYDQINASVMQSDGKLVVAGSQYESKSSYNFCLARYETGVISVGETESDMAFHIHPNPTEDIINLTFSGLADEPLVLRIQDYVGKVIVEEIVPPHSTRIEVQENIAPGCYIVSIVAENCIISSLRLIKRN